MHQRMCADSTLCEKWRLGFDWEEIPSEKQVVDSGEPSMSSLVLGLTFSIMLRHKINHSLIWSFTSGLAQQHVRVSLTKIIPCPQQRCTRIKC